MNRYPSNFGITLESFDSFTVVKNLYISNIPYIHCLSQNNGDANDSDAVTTAVEVITSPNGDNSGLTAER